MWYWIAEINRGGLLLQVAIKGTDDAGSAVGVSGTQTLRFSKDDIKGGLYYTTSNGSGIMRFDLASTTPTAVQFLGTGLTNGTCVGCHAVSRDGRKVVAEAG